jgi:hypothetical protein
MQLTRQVCHKDGVGMQMRACNEITQLHCVSILPDS